MTGSKVRKLLTIPEIRQIGGRAGRYRTSAQDGKSAPDSKKGASSASSEQKCGYVTSFESSDLDIIRKSIATDPAPIAQFGVAPTDAMVELFYNCFPAGIPYSFILARIFNTSEVSSRYFFCEVGETLEIADAIQSVKNMSVAERIKMCFAPASMRVEGQAELMKEIAEAVANQTGGDLLDLKTINFDVLDLPVKATRPYLHKLEVLHKSLVLYNWMSFRFPGVFTQRPLAMKAKQLVEKNIDECLLQFKYGDVNKTRVKSEMITDLLRQLDERAAGRDTLAATPQQQAEEAEIEEEDASERTLPDEPSSQDVLSTDMAESISQSAGEDAESATSKAKE
jgi:ATP-dependent RNA helicase SUPV3L1/SUV3